MTVLNPQIYTNASRVETFPVNFNLDYDFHFSLKETFFAGKKWKVTPSVNT